MSSLAVRNKIKTFLTTNLPEESRVVDLTADFEELNRDILGPSGITRNHTWLGLQFIGGEEEGITVPATNDVGRYREIGVIYFHIVAPIGLNVADNLIARAELLRTRFRGQNIDNLRVTSVSTINTQAGETLQAEGGWTSGSVLVSYENDIDL